MNYSGNTAWKVTIQFYHEKAQNYVRNFININDTLLIK